MDIFDEFFIHKVEGSGLQPGKENDDKSTNLNATTMSAISSNAPSNLNVVSTILAMSPENNQTDSTNDDWTSVFTLRLSMLPTSYIPATLG